jgi:hypothetical protein
MISIESTSSVREWVEKKADSRWKRTVVSFLDYIDNLHSDPRIDKRQKLALLAGCREGISKLTHPHHSSTSGLHLVLDVIDDRLRELGYRIPESCHARWRP